uniref:Retrovirus-related Pol polyprotein from transposon TNT 1-94 n=1 Tax=Tanacetum cinerariifolium TaxID=118510 RepID=A0A699KY14_TANCI|nr:retrovirus-related Pol polyprotein from transposon TNT 1-94 [Tanacetum cinerariifolium]
MNVHEIDDGTGMADARKFSGTSNISHSRATRLGICSWSIIKEQATVALSSTEAEYISAAIAACQAVWLRRVLEDLNQTQDDKNVQLLSLATTGQQLRKTELNSNKDNYTKKTKVITILISYCVQKRVTENEE